MMLSCSCISHHIIIAVKPDDVSSISYTCLDMVNDNLRQKYKKTICLMILLCNMQGIGNIYVRGHWIFGDYC
jgi:hypothetical protein